MNEIMGLCDAVRETGFAIHRYHKHGHLEKVYENALAHLGYLRASRIEHGLLINFGAPKFQIKKYALTQGVEQGGFCGMVGFVCSLFAPFAPFGG